MHVSTAEFARDRLGSIVLRFLLHIRYVFIGHDIGPVRVETGQVSGFEGRHVLGEITDRVGDGVIQRRRSVSQKGNQESRFPYKRFKNEGKKKVRIKEGKKGSTVLKEIRTQYYIYGQSSMGCLFV